MTMREKFMLAVVAATFAIVMLVGLGRDAKQWHNEQFKEVRDAGVD